jgi:hypothetical protein
MTESPAPVSPDPDSYEKITPFIEGAILELALLAVKLVTTPFAVLFNTSDFRGQIKAFRGNLLNARYSPTVARPLSFYVLWMAAHFLLASLYWRYVSREKFPSAGTQIPEQLEKAADFLKAQAWSDVTGKAEALIIVAFAVTLIIGSKSALVALIGRCIGCRIRFETVLYASAYSMGTLIFFQYLFILSHYSINTMLGISQMQPAAYYVLVYCSILICIVLVVRVNQMIQRIDGTSEIPTFVSWFVGTLIWLYLIITATGMLFGTPITILAFVRAFYGALIPGPPL